MKGWNAWRLRHGVAKATIVFNGCAHAAARRAANNTKAFVPRSRNRLTNIHFVYSLFKQVQPPTGIKRERVWNRVSCSSQNRACYKGDISGITVNQQGNTATLLRRSCIQSTFFQTVDIWEKNDYDDCLYREKINIITIIFTSVGYGRKLSKYIWIASKQKVTATHTKPGSQRIKSTRMSTNLLIVDAKKSLYTSVCVSCSL